MALSDDFREQLRAGNITEALALALSEAVELKITTWVASEADEVDVTQSQSGHRLHTRINIVDGDIENEVGDQFLSHGRYRELQQFHLQQVAEGNKIIQNNLQSLQKLFEVLIALRYPSAAPPAVEPETPSVDSQLLPPAPAVTDFGIAIAPDESALEDFVAPPDPVVESVTDAGIAIAPHESDIRLDTVIQEEVVPQPPVSPSVEPSSDWETDEDDDDWDNSILDLLESLPVEPLPLEASDREIIGDLGDLAQVEPQPIPTTEQRSDENLSPPASSAYVPEGTPPLDDFDSSPESPKPNIQALNASSDEEDWGDFAEEEPQSNPKKPLLSMESLDLEEDEEWDDWLVEEPESVEERSAIATDSLQLQDDDDWGDLMDDFDPFTEAPAVSQPASGIQVEEDWDEFSPEELEPYSVTLDVEAHPDTNVDPPASPENATGNPAPSDNPKKDPLAELERFSPNPPQDNALDPLEDWFEDSEEKDWDDEEIPTQQGENSVEQTRFDQKSEQESSTAPEGTEDNANDKRTWFGRRIPPPPPPPSRFPRPE